MRVSRSELGRFLTGECIEETIHFSSEPDAKLTYRLETAADHVATRVNYRSGEVAVLLSKNHVKTWSDPSQVGIYTSVDIGLKGSLDLVVEKDFACLDKSDEDNLDTFANPHADAIS